MKPLYWVLIGLAILIIVPIKMYVFKRMMAKKEQQQPFDE